jgi:hypothetical protein
MSWVRLGDQLYKMGKVTILYHEPQPKTQSKHTTTNMSRRRPTHQRLWPSFSMATSAMALDLVTAAPYGSVAGVGCPVRSCSCCCRFCQLERRNRMHKKIERCAGLWP